jgi:hypothetical protein
MVRNFPRTPGPDAKVAAVLILLFPDNGSIHTVLMQRHDYKGNHGEMINLKFFDYDSNVIWGATAMMLYELLTIIRRGSIPLILK